MNAQIDGFTNHINQIQKINRFITETLPVSTHFQICEAFDFILGQEYKQPCRKFERHKSREIENYLGNARNINCTEKLSHRIKALFELYRTKNQGLLPFRLDRDIDPLATVASQKHVPVKDIEIALQKNLDQAKEIEKAYTEAFAQCKLGKRLQNPTVLEHKLAKLEGW